VFRSVDSALQGVERPGSQFARDRGAGQPRSRGPYVVQVLPQVFGRAPSRGGRVV
jgi:hypothetical protein